jgi:hypothetical protein
VIRTNFTQKLAKKLEKFFIYRRNISKMIHHQLQVGEQAVEKKLIFTCRENFASFHFPRLFAAANVEEISAKRAQRRPNIFEATLNYLAKHNNFRDP